MPKYAQQRSKANATCDESDPGFSATIDRKIAIRTVNVGDGTRVKSPSSLIMKDTSAPDAGAEQMENGFSFIEKGLWPTFSQANCPAW